MEENKEKCYKYFGNSLNSSINCGPFFITTRSEQWKNLDKDTKIATRILQVKKGADTRQIYHFHYDTWPDKVCHPHCCDLLCNAVGFSGNSQDYRTGAQSPETNGRHKKRSRQTGSGQRSKLASHHSLLRRNRTNWNPRYVWLFSRSFPFYVHIDPVSLDICIDMVEKFKRVPDVAAVVKQVRKQRLHAVQTESKSLWGRSEPMEFLCFQDNIGSFTTPSWKSASRIDCCSRKIWT